MKKTPIALTGITLAALAVSPAAARELETSESLAVETLPHLEHLPRIHEPSNGVPTLSPSPSLSRSPLAPLAKGGKWARGNQSTELPTEDSAIAQIPTSETFAPETIETATSLYEDVQTEAKFLEPNGEDIAASPEPPAASPSPAVELAQNTPVRPVRQGFYGSISGDWRFLGSVDIIGGNIPPVGAIGAIETEFNSGFGINGAAGYKFPNNIRIEGQIAYGRNAIGDVNLPGVPAVLGAPVTAPLFTAANAVIPQGTNINGIIVPADIPVGNIPLNPGTPPTLAQDIPIPVVGGTIPAGTQIPPGIATTGGGTTTPVIQPEIPAVTVNASGSLSTLSALFNVYYDIDTQSNWEPYVGGGIGISRVAANNLSVTYPGTTLTASVDDSALGLVYQLMAGVAYYFNPQTAVTVGYRYFDSVGGNSFGTPFGDVDLEGIGFHNLEVGLRYFF